MTPTIVTRTPGKPRPVPQAERHGAGTPDITDLVMRAQQGDPDAIADIYRRYMEPIYRFVAAKVTNRMDREDITADVFVRAISGIGRLAYPGGCLTAWLYAIASNAVIDHHRRQRTRREDPYPHPDDGVDPADPGADPAALYDVHLTNTALHAAIRALPRVQGKVMVLRFLLGLSPERVGLALNLTVPSVRSHQHRALTALRQSGHFSETPPAGAANPKGRRPATTSMNVAA